MVFETTDIHHDHRLVGDVPLITTSFFQQTEKLRTELLQDFRLAPYINLLANHHQDTYFHTLRVCSLSLDLGLENGLKAPLINYLGYASLLHDIGKTLIPRNLLTKTTGLDSLEQEMMREHVRLGFRVLETFEPGIVKEIVVSHHEFSNAPYPRNGLDRRQTARYPNRRKRRQAAIDQAVQILAVADMFDALIQPRAYKAAYQKEETEAVLRREFTGDSSLIDQVLHRWNGG